MKTRHEIPCPPVKHRQLQHHQRSRSDPITVASGGAVTGSGLVSGALDNEGMITASEGLLEIAGAVAGTGSLDVSPNATLKLDDAVGPGQAVNFNAANETVVLGDFAGFQAEIFGFRAGDAIVIPGLSSSDTLQFDPISNEWEILSGTTEVGALTFVGAFMPTALQLLGTSILDAAGAGILQLAGGGPYVMSADATGVGQVNLLPPPSGQTQPAWNFTANGLANLAIDDRSGSDNTITFGSPGQSVLTYGSGTIDHVIADGAEAGNLVQNLSHTPDVFEITDGGSFALNPASFNVIAELDQPSTLTLNGTFVGVESSTGGDTVVLSAAVLNETTRINLGGVYNTLTLDGGGYFHLSLPSVLTGIDVVTAEEGQATYNPLGIASSEPTVYLRDGQSVTIEVTSDPNPNPANPNPAGIVIHGANDADLIQLATGLDTVFLGSSSETVIGGGGNDTFYASAATANATIDGGTGASVLNLTGGGAVTLGSNISDIAQLNLSAPSAGQTQSAWNVIAPAIAGLKIVDFSNESDVITFSAAGQSVTNLGGGADVFRFSMPNAGVDRIANFQSGLDHIGLSATGFGFGNLSDVSFDIGSSPTLAPNDQPTILYDTTSGNLYFDAHGGDGNLVQFAILNGHPSLLASDFVLT